jgi:hypothetical protein
MIVLLNNAREWIVVRAITSVNTVFVMDCGAIAARRSNLLRRPL